MCVCTPCTPPAILGRAKEDLSSNCHVDRLHALARLQESQTKKNHLKVLDALQSCTSLFSNLVRPSFHISTTLIVINHMNKVHMPEVKLDGTRVFHKGVLFTAMGPDVELLETRGAESVEK